MTLEGIVSAVALALFMSGGAILTHLIQHIH
jgi:hypothetical protein